MTAKLIDLRFVRDFRGTWVLKHDVPIVQWHFDFVAGGPTAEGTVCDTGERYEVLQVRFCDGSLALMARLPSNGHIVRQELRAAADGSVAVSSITQQRLVRSSPIRSPTYGAQHPLARACGLFGSWVDDPEDPGDEWWIAHAVGQIVIDGIDWEDGEDYDVREIVFKDDILRFDAQIPSTAQVFRHALRLLDDDTILDVKTFVDFWVRVKA